MIAAYTPTHRANQVFEGIASGADPTAAVQPVRPARVLYGPLRQLRPFSAADASLLQKVRALPGCDADRFVAAFGLPKRFTRARLVVVTCEHLLLLKEDGSEYIKCNMQGFSKVMRVAPCGLAALTHSHTHAHTLACRYTEKAPR